MTKNSLQPTRRWNIKEPFCSLSHGFGLILSVVAFVVLMILSQGRLWHVLGFSIYGASLIITYLASTLYHTLHTSPKGEERLQKFDYIAIFLMIAGTYAPVCLIALRGPWGWSLLGIEYGLAALGIATIFWRGGIAWLRVAICVAMGWLVVTALGPLHQAIPPSALAWLWGGGIAFSIGTAIYAADWPHLWPGRFSAHDLWHIFVLGGSTCHFILLCRLA